MAMSLTRSDRRIIFQGLPGSERDLMNEGQANFVIGNLTRGFKTWNSFAAVNYRNRGLFWEENEKNQRCIFKFRMRNSSNLRAHFNYLGREGTAQDGNNPSPFFNHDCDNLAGKNIEYTDPSQINTILFRPRTKLPGVIAEINRAKKENQDVEEISLLEVFKSAPEEENSFRFILSPEFSGGVPLMEFTRCFMERMESEIGTRLAWVATTHYDTGHPHIHIVVRGMNEYLQPLFFHPDILFNAARVWAREVLTTYRGERTADDIINAYRKEATAEYYTKLDVMLEKSANDSEGTNRGKVVFSQFSARADIGSNILVALDNRLKFLSNIGMATKVSPNIWTLAPNLKESLRDKQVQGDIIRSIGMHKEMLKSTQKIFTIDAAFLEKKGGIFGRIVYRQFVPTDDFGDSVDLFIEDMNGDIFMHRLTRKNEAMLPGLNARDFCAISTPNRYDKIDDIVSREITNAPAADDGTITIRVDKDFLRRNELAEDQIFVIKRRVQHYVEFGLCAIKESERDVLTVQFENSAIVSIQALRQKRGQKHSIVSEGNANREDFQAQIERVGLTFLDRYLMHQCNLAKDFIIIRGEVAHVPTLQADDSAFAGWYLDLIGAVCRRIEYHIKSRRIWVAQTNDDKEELRYDKNFTENMWAERTQFARIVYENETGKKIGAPRNPAPSEYIEGTIHIFEKFNLAFVAEEGKTCVVLPAINTMRRRDNQSVRFAYPELFARNKQALDFYLQIEQIQLSSEKQKVPPTKEKRTAKGDRDGK